MHADKKSRSSPCFAQHIGAVDDHIFARMHGPETKGETGMSSMIVFTCPNTGHDVSSGVLADERTFSRLPRHELIVRCKECGGEHRWWVAEGRLGKVEEVRLPMPVRIP